MLDSNIQLQPSWKVNIHYYQIEDDLFPKAQSSERNKSF